MDSFQLFFHCITLIARLIIFRPSSVDEVIFKLQSRYRSEGKERAGLPSVGRPTSSLFRVIIAKRAGVVSTVCAA